MKLLLSILLMVSLFADNASEDLDSLFAVVKDYEQRHSYDSAFSLAVSGVEKSVELKDGTFESKFNIRLGTILSEVERNEEAINYYKKAYDIAEELQNDRLIGQSLLGIGVTYQLTDHSDSALYYYDLSLPYLLTSNDQINYSGTLANMALIYNQRGNIAKAEQLFLRSITRRKSLGDLKGLAGSYANMGRLYLSINKPTDAISYFLKSLEVAASNDLETDARIAHQSLTRAYFQVSKLDSAQYYFEQYNRLIEEWIHADYGDRLLELETKFRTSEIEKENAVKQLQIEQQQQAQLIMGGVIVLLLFAGTGIYFYYDQKRKNLIALAAKDKQLYDQQIEELLNEEEIKTTYALLEGQDKERKRIAQELHDNISSTMATLNMFLSSFQPGSLDEKNKDLLDRINKVAFQTAEDTRKLSHSLDSGSLSHFGLEVAIRDLMEAVQRSGLRSELNLDIKHALPGDLTLNTYRIIQELVNNTLKHAKASKIELEISEIPDEYLSIIYADDGVGFDASQVDKGIGLKNIRSRLDAMEGQLNIDAVPDRHTSFIIEIPLT